MRIERISGDLTDHYQYQLQILVILILVLCIVTTVGVCVIHMNSDENLDISDDKNKAKTWLTGDDIKEAKASSIKR